jgi:hypothetical protein
MGEKLPYTDQYVVAKAMVQMSVGHGQSSGLKNVRSKHRAQKERSVRVPHRPLSTANARFPNPAMSFFVVEPY